MTNARTSCPPRYESLSEVRADEPVCARDQSLRHECIADLYLLEEHCG